MTSDRNTKSACVDDACAFLFISTPHHHNITSQQPNIMDKFLIVGLGNPGAEYDHTRHNTGFMVVDELAKSVGATFEDKRYGFVAETSLKGRKVFILKQIGRASCRERV